MSVGQDVELPPGPRAEEEGAAVGQSHPPDPPGALRRLVLRGAFWTVASYGASQLLRLGGNLILTRLLVPEAFGLMALVQSFLTGLAMFSDIGAGASIVRHPRGEEPAFLNTAWTLQVLRGVGLWAGAALLAWPVAHFYGDPRLLGLLPLAGLNSVIVGFGSTSLFVLNRRLGVARLAIFELATYAISLLVITAWVWYRPTVWSLVVASLMGSTIRTAWSHFLLAGTPNRLALDRVAMHQLLSFGKWLFLSTAMTFLGEQSDRLVLGKLLPLAVLGIYGVAAALADMPRQLSMALNARVIYPAISRLAHLPRAEMRAKIIRNRKAMLIVWALGTAVLAGFGDVVIHVLYDRRYQQAAWMLPMLILGIWPRVLSNTIESSLFAVGRPQYSTLANALRFLTTAIGIPLGHAWLGVPGAVMAIALNDVPYYAAANFGLRREGLAAMRQDAAATALLLATLVVVIAARAAAGYGTPWGPLP